MSDTSLDTMPQSLPGASFDAYNSVEGFTAYLQEQARSVSELRRGDNKVIKLLKCVVHILHAISTDLVRWIALVNLCLQKLLL